MNDYSFTMSDYTQIETKPDDQNWADQKRKALDIVSKDGKRLKYGPEWWLTDREIVEAAIMQNPFSLRYAPSFYDDDKMVKLAVQLNGLTRVWASPRLREDEEICKATDKKLLRGMRTSSLSTEPDCRIFFADDEKGSAVKKLATIFNEVAFLELENKTHSPFLRDSRVTLFGGKHVIPYAIKNPLLAEMVRAMISPSLDNFAGKGFRECNVDQAMITSIDFNIPFSQGKSCIEGGNCFLFMSKGTRKAIVGEISVYLSMFALEEQGYFKQVKLIEAKLSLTRDCIAEELDLPLENITFVPQTKFHIDMEMMVTPQGEVMLHDDEVTLEFLEKIKKSEHLKKEEKELLEQYRESAREGSKVFKDVREERMKILQKNGLSFVRMPAVLEAPLSKSSLNYCNGIFAQNGKRFIILNTDEIIQGLEKAENFTYITTGPSSQNEQVFHRRFIDLFQKTFPKVTFCGIPGMSKFIAERRGGIRCLSFECSLPFEE